MTYNIIIDKNVQAIFPTAKEIINRKSENYKTNFDSIKTSGFQQHFTDSRLAIDEACKGLTGRAVFLGVGAANDFNLEKVVRQFNEVFFLDIEIGPAKAAVETKVAKEFWSKITLIQMDITGVLGWFSKDLENLALQVDQQSYPSAATSLLSRYKCNVFSRTAQSTSVGGFLSSMVLESFVDTTRPFKLDQKSASFVASSMVHSEIVTYLAEYIQTVYQKTFATTGRVTLNDDFWSYCDHFVEQQIGYMQMLLKPEGAFYFSDTFSVTNEKFGTMNTPTAFAMTQQLKGLDLVKKEWDWVGDSVMHVKAFHNNRAST